MPPEHQQPTQAPVPASNRGTSTSTTTSTSGADSTTAVANPGNQAAQADAGLGAAPVSEGGLDGLRSATETGNADEAFAIFGTLAPEDIATLKDDTAFVPRFLSLIGPEHAATALWTLQYPIRLYLELANIHCAADIAILSRVLGDVGIHGASDLAVHAGDLTDLRGFLVSVILDPVLAVSSPAEDAELVGSIGGHDLLLPVYTGSPLVFTHYLGTESNIVLDLFVTSEPARTLLLEQPVVLDDHILTQWQTPVPWHRTVGELRLGDLDGLLSAQPAPWATSLLTLLEAGDPIDSLLLAPPSDLARLILGTIARQDPVQAAHVCAALNLNRVACLQLFAAEGWLTLTSAEMLLAQTDLVTQTAVAVTPETATALAAFAWIEDLLPLLTAQPDVLAGLYGTQAAVRAWVDVDPGRFEALAKRDPAIWVPAFILSGSATLLLQFAANDPVVWRAAVDDTVFAAILALLPKPCAETDVPGVWGLWLDANRSLAVGLDTYYTLYGLRIWTSGAQPEWAMSDWVNTDVTPAITYQRKEVINTVDPTQAALNDYLTHLATIPRGQVAASAVGFGNGWTIHFKRKTRPADAAWDASEPAITEDGHTSQYWNTSNFILMYTDTAGGFSGAQAWMNGPQDVADDGNSGGVGGGRETTDPATGNTTPAAATTDTALTYFQNHARHEVGHGVGARAFQGMAMRGDTASKTWANWTNSSAASMRAAYFAGMSGNITDVQDTASVNKTVSASEIGLYLTTVVSTGAEPAAATAPGTGGQMTGLFAGTMNDRLSGISISSAGSSALAQYVNVVVTSNGRRQVPSRSYKYPGFTPPGESAYIYSDAEHGFRKYDTAVMTEILPVLGWYSLSSASELFAEIYTQHYSTGAHWVPSVRKNVDFGTFFTQLEASPQAQLQAGVTPTITGVGGAPAPGAAAAVPAPVGPAAVPPTPGAGPAVSEATAGAQGTPI